MPGKNNIKLKSVKGKPAIYVQKKEVILNQDDLLYENKNLIH